MGKKRPILLWDESEILAREAKYRNKNKKEFGYEGMNDREVELAVWEDYDFLDAERDFMVDALTEIMRKKNPSGLWEATVKGFGWRGLSGEKSTFRADNGAELLQQILPKTDCTYYIYHYGKKGLAINNFHHDAPTGKEWYYIAPARAEEAT